MTIELARACGLNWRRQALLPNTSGAEPNRGASASQIKLATLVGLFLFAPLGHAATVNWATWTMPSYSSSYNLTGVTGNDLIDLTPSSYATGITGTVVNPNNSTSVGLTISGEISAYSKTNFAWSSVVPPAPDYASIPNSGTMLAQTGYAGTYDAHTLSFAGPAVTNVLMTLYSLGTPNVISTLTFSQPFVILSAANVFTSSLDGYTLTGKEGHGLIQFLGTYNSISWTVTKPEVFSGFNVGFTTTPYEPPAAVPTPPTLWLFAAGLLGIGAVRRKRV